MGETAPRIDHIGSTSVPGLDAKPIIDTQISVASFEPLDTYRIPIESLGFVFRANNPDLTKRYFREKPGIRRTHEADARRYAEFKYHLVGQYRDNRIGDTNEKGPFIWEIMVKAHDWSQEAGWESGPSDA